MGQVGITLIQCIANNGLYPRLYDTKVIFEKIRCRVYFGYYRMGISTKHDTDESANNLIQKTLRFLSIDFRYSIDLRLLAVRNNAQIINGYTKNI